MSDTKGEKFQKFHEIYETFEVEIFNSHHYIGPIWFPVCVPLQLCLYLSVAYRFQDIVSHFSKFKKDTEHTP